MSFDANEILLETDMGMLFYEYGISPFFIGGAVYFLTKNKCLLKKICKNDKIASKRASKKANKRANQQVNKEWTHEKKRKEKKQIE